jgi:hypothetical protein
MSFRQGLPMPSHRAGKVAEVAMGTLLIILLIVLLLGGGGSYYAHGRYGPAGSGGVVGVVIVVLLVLWFVGAFSTGVPVRP